MNAIAEIRLWNERFMGEMLAGAIRAGNPQLSSEPTIRLTEIGITRDQSSRYQSLAEIPEETFTAAIEDARAAEEPLTARGIVVAGHDRNHAPIGHAPAAPAGGG
jgi:hypothetical protein